MKRPRAIVFDCDGVLVDSEPHSIKAWVDVMGQLDHPGRAADVEACVGHSFVRTHGALSAIADLPPPEEVWPMLMGFLERSFSDGVEAFSDAVEMLDRAESLGISTAVASASPRERLELTLRLTGLSDRFSVSVSGDEVRQNKPAPDIYLEAVAGLRIEPGEAWAIEDTTSGVRSATDAGLQTIAVARSDEHRAGLEATSAIVVDRLSPDLIPDQGLDPVP